MDETGGKTVMDSENRNLDDWVARLSGIEIPVLRHTARELARLREDPDAIDARSVAHVLLHDPLMTAKLLRHFEGTRRKGRSTEVVRSSRC